MTKHRFHMLFGVRVAAIAAAVVATPAQTQITAADQWPILPPYTDQRGIQQDIEAVRDFDRRVTEYVTLHRLLEGPLPPLQVSSDMRVVRAAMDALAHRIQTARATARQGDLFTPEVARVFRKRIAACLSPEEWVEILTMREEADPIIVPPIRVNARWPELMPFNYVPPQMLAGLPRLPAELQYRIIGRSLVLWDHHADLIVDFIPGAFTT